MFYSFLKVLVRFTLKIFFRKIFITGIDHIKSDRPQLVASNHPNGFLEPLIMACFFPKPLHFLVRGDVFENPLLRPLLKSTNQIPIYRFRDGFSKLRENSQKMDESIQVLLDKKNLLIFSEGNTESIKKLRPLQKGISRIAFHTVEKDIDLDLEILPIGINFTYPAMFDETVMLKVGKPLKVREYMDQYVRDNKTGHENLLDDLFIAMKKNIIHLEDQKRIKIFEKLVILVRSRNPYAYLPVFRNDLGHLENEKKLAEKLDTLPDHKLELLRDNMKELELEMAKEKISLHNLQKIPVHFVSALVLVLGFLPAMTGAFFHFLPLMSAYLFTKTKVKQKEFRASILMVSALLLCMTTYLIYIIIIVVMGLPLYWLAIIIITGLWLRWYYQVWANTFFASGYTLEKFKNKGYQILDNL
jgi:1-acyl-sn-glycerol-3-phosphate acyltransferase